MSSYNIPNMKGRKIASEKEMRKTIAKAQRQVNAIRKSKEFRDSSVENLTSWSRTLKANGFARTSNFTGGNKDEYKTDKRVSKKTAEKNLDKIVRQYNIALDFLSSRQSSIKGLREIKKERIEQIQETASVEFQIEITKKDASMLNKIFQLSHWADETTMIDSESIIRSYMDIKTKYGRGQIKGKQLKNFSEEVLELIKLEKDLDAQVALRREYRRLYATKKK